MAVPGELTTVYRSADRNAETDATAIKNLLMKGGLNPVLLDDTTPGVVAGTWEVRVPGEEVQIAEQIIAETNQEDPGAADPSRELDLVSVATTDGAISEIEALSIQGILDANGINCVVVGTSQLPNLGFEVRVAREDLDRARRVMEEAQAAGPAAASEAQREAEMQSGQKGE